MLQYALLRHAGISRALPPLHRTAALSRRAEGYKGSRMDAVEKEKFPRKQMELQRMQLHRSLSKTPGESSKGLQFSQTTIESGAMHTLFFRANMAAVGKARFPVHGAFQSGIMRSGMFAGRTWRPVIPWCKCRENPRARNQRKCALRMVPIPDADRSEDPPGNKA